MSLHTEKIAQNLYAIAAEKMKPLVVVVDDSNNYVSHYGNLGNYDLPDLIVGKDCIEELPFLVGIEDEPYVVLPLVSFENDSVASVNIVKINQSRYVIMLDAKAEHQVQQKTTQVSNETMMLNVKLRQLTEQLTQAHLDLEHRNEQLKLASSAKSRFISGMSHEFRTPISSIVGYSNILASKYDPKDENYRYAKAIERNTQYLLSLIDNVLEHAQLETDKLIINITAFNTEEFLSDIKQMFISHAKESGLAFKLEASSNLPDVIRSDRIRLLQILINIIGNAFKYTEEGSVEVKFNWFDDELIVTVTDTGPGIAVENQALVFQAYSRGDVDNKKGAGLGLSISAQLVEKLGGKLELTSEVGVGSVFTITVKAERVHATASDHLSDITRNKEAKILIVEDDVDLVELLKIYLNEFGYSTVVALDGDEALRQCQNEHLDLILLDMQLPKLSGIEVAKQLIESGFKSPIIGMTASSNNEDRTRALAAGCEEFLSKPIQVTPLLDTINKLLAVDA